MEEEVSYAAGFAAVGSSIFRCGGIFWTCRLPDKGGKEERDKHQTDKE